MLQDSLTHALSRCSCSIDTNIFSQANAGYDNKCNDKCNAQLAGLKT